MKSKKGMLITFEGGEGCGKSTHANLLKDYLENKGFEVFVVREPGGTKTGEKLRQILLEEKSKISPFTELLIFLASRRELVVKVIEPTLREGKIVICDRFMDSTVAYQGYGRGIDITLINKLNNMVVGKKAFPKLTFVLDTDKHLGFKLKGEDRIEVENESFHKKVRKGYLEIAKQNPKRVKLIKVEGEIADIQKKIREIVEKHLHIE
ncbi:MAG: dTMP kinase [Candidatus Ratteibacteria bacterium]|nr:dTMP kinase [Candidatus Ratteibacteria bacterium]